MAGKKSTSGPDTMQGRPGGWEGVGAGFSGTDAERLRGPSAGGEAGGSPLLSLVGPELAKLEVQRFSTLMEPIGCIS